MIFVFGWFLVFFYLFFMTIKKFDFILSKFFGLICRNFVHQSLQSSFFFKFSVFLLMVFWLGGLFFPLFSPWSSIIYLFFFTVFSWLGVRTFTLLIFNFGIMFEEEVEWGLLTSLFMFFSHWLSFLMSGVALCLRISIIFLIGHFMMFFLFNFSFFFFLFFFIVNYSFSIVFCFFAKLYFFSFN